MRGEQLFAAHWAQQPETGLERGTASRWQAEPCKDASYWGKMHPRGKVSLGSSPGSCSGGPKEPPPLPRTAGWMAVAQGHGAVPPESPGTLTAVHSWPWPAMPDHLCCCKERSPPALIITLLSLNSHFPGVDESLALPPLRARGPRGARAWPASAHRWPGQLHGLSRRPAPCQHGACSRLALEGAAAEEAAALVQSFPRSVSWQAAVRLVSRFSLQAAPWGPGPGNQSSLPSARCSWQPALVPAGERAGTDAKAWLLPPASRGSLISHSPLPSKHLSATLTLAASCSLPTHAAALGEPGLEAPAASREAAGSWFKVK